MCETDFSGYPDCRDDTIKAQQVTLSLRLGRQLTIETPLMQLDKAATWALAYRLGGSALVELIVEYTCYRGRRTRRHLSDEVKMELFFVRFPLVPRPAYQHYGNHD
jgi:7-cyano-7-deazaguanine synthase